MAHKAVFKNVWMQNDLKVQQDAIAAWSAAGAVSGAFDPQKRVKELCVVGYEGDELVAISTAHLRYLPAVRETMALFRVFVAAGHRQKGLVIPLTYATHDAMSAYAVAHPKLRIGGTAGIVSVHGTMDKPVTNADMVLVGYTPNNDPLLVRWFDHFKLDEEAARARSPKRTR
ncbi:MAG: hypothetical protein HY243_00550 [Proteobacteria bacterium]|nr:hypothetical protein [Pseudomonadota bacterium]